MEPVVYLMVLCEEARVRPGTSRKIDILGVISAANVPEHAFPVQFTFCVYLCLTDGHGIGRGQIRVVEEDLEQIVYEGDEHPFDFGNDPLALISSTIRVPSCLLPSPGRYRVEFVYITSAIIIRT